ncbi:hypothetical protein [Effusibacillus pohliae]|uniref:hypothetical protein n=1 Tax=Effusibacillus pohliae TaxID=232270 RepID=UPI00035F157A|nr:hypothetical protein [Effusibacillus pohliae]
MDEQLKRLEDMLGQLVKMVGHVNNRLNEMENRFQERFDEMENRFEERFNQLASKIDDVSGSVNHLIHKVAEQERDIYLLKSKRA